jgi:signal transduction histidine kinase
MNFAMNTWQAGEILDAAVKTLISERCRRAYIHDMRGGLQAVYSSVEVLARSAKHNAANTALIDNASSMAKRAMAAHEQALVDIVDQVTGRDDLPTVLNLASVVKQAQQFLRNDALSKGIKFGLSGCEDMVLLSQRNRLRSLLLGLLALGIDGLPAGAELHVELRRVDGYALLELRSDLAYNAILEAEDILCPEPVNLHPQDLVLEFARRWIKERGGRVEIHSLVGAQTGLRIYYPLAATCAGERATPAESA